MPDQKSRRTLTILNVLGGYILLQVIWWGYLLIAVNTRLAAAEGREDDTLRQVWMIAGEGSVFLILLFVGFRRIRRNIRREMHFANVQRTFLLAVTHELKTPVAAIKLQLETLNHRSVSPEISRRMLADALKEASRLEGLTGNILLATRLDQEGLASHGFSVSLTDLVRGEASRFASLYRDLRLFEIHIEDDVETSGEPELLRAVFFNLIENAVKYSPENGRIRISLRTKNDQAVFEAEDEGAGVPDGEKSRIFEKFYRPGNEQTRRHKGTGLGLYIVQTAVRLHRGHVAVSDAVPRGARFTVTLPLHHAER
jgi:signal transduction histidine kinase